MIDAMNPRDRMQHRAMLLLLGLAAVAALAATTMHLLEASPRPMDLVIPPGLALFYSISFLVLYFRPQSLRIVIPAAFGVGFVGLAVPAWFYPVLATNTGKPLIDILPPIVPALAPLLAGIMLFLRPPGVIITGFVAWLAIAFPIIAYLLINPAQLAFPRGQELVVGLGPAMGILVVVLYLHVDMNRRLSAAHSEIQRLNLEAERDRVTGLFNRRGGEAMLERILSGIDPRGAAVLFEIDQYPELEGTVDCDELLAMLVRRCEEFLRRQDLFIHWAPARFLVIVDDADIGECEVLAEHLRQIISGKMFREAGYLSASFGVTEIMPGDSNSTLLRRIEAALDSARATGGDCVQAIAW
ncbi:MAG: diguanylate cyclase [Gammaproteobacteria bacterium]|nr:diguanylate cyclase [Gammaproteobacteria bacterium]